MMPGDILLRRHFILFLCELLEENEDTREIGRFWRFLVEQCQSKPEKTKLLSTMTLEEKETLIVKYLGSIAAEDASDKSKADKDIFSDVVNHSTVVEDSEVGRHVSKDLAMAFETLGMFISHEGLNFVESISNLSYALGILFFERLILDDYLKSNDIPKDIVGIFLKFRDSIRKSYGPVEKLRLFVQELGHQQERIYGITSIPIRSLGVYQRGHIFYKRAEESRSKLTLTISNTSGLFNPFERLGTKPFLKLIGSTTEESRLPLKHAMRATNFEDGILNPSIDCRRIYLWNKARTFESFKKSWEIASNKEAFVSEVRKYLNQMQIMSSQENLICCEVDNFESLPALMYLTRLSENTMMWSNRNSETDITHAFWFNLGEDFNIEQRGKKK
ncbi:MAG: hypothetical protein WC454_07030, partial [Phycisphaerae bacterium]